MSILVVGSIAFDSVETPFGKVKEVLGGSASYFSIAASFFANVRLVAVVGEDFPQEHLDFFQEKGVDLQGLQRLPGLTFRWEGKYGQNINERQTLSTCLNVFEVFQPEIPEQYRSSQYVFLANIDPDLQLKVLKQVNAPKLTVGDTMNFYIEGNLSGVKESLRAMDIMTINEEEVKQLTGETNLVRAAKKILSFGPKTVIIKRGEYGALMLSRDSIFSVPAYPLETVCDPTGAGDSFAGGFLGYLARNRKCDDKSLRKAVIFGSVMASFCVEDFSLNRLKSLSYSEIEKRFGEFKELTKF
ncbi:MAG: sugar kinase [Deltaproteobacteria bacterium]|nr:MAG: sugar kinase [Deltaproteobacteria bacterium]